MKQDKPRPWKKLGSSTSYRDHIHLLRWDVELPNGKRMGYDVDHNDGFAAATLIKTPADTIYLSHQYRLPVDRWIYDLPGGGAQPGEAPEQTAIRECREEVGLKPKKVIRLAKFYPNPARTDWPAYVFFCNDYEESKIDQQDPAEHVERVELSVVDFKKLVDAQEIVDPMLLVAWYAACSKGLIKL